MINKEELRKNKFIKWLLEKQVINDDDSFIEKLWKYQWNAKASILIECGILIIILNLLRDNGII